MAKSAAIAPPRWDSVDAAVERAVNVFLEATQSVRGIRQIHARSSGPTVHFLVMVDGAWDAVIDAIEANLFPLAKAGKLPSLDYDVAKAPIELEPGYAQLYPG
jgi:hypothetical protein